MIYRIKAVFAFSLIFILMVFCLSSCDDAGVTTTSITSANRFTKTYGGASSDYLASMAPLTGGGFILGGFSISSGAGDNDFYVMKTGISGDVVWSKTYGGSGNDMCNSVIQTSEGGFMAAGETTSFGATGSDVCLVKIDANGAVTWSKIYKLTGDQFVFSVIQDSDGGYVVCGYTNQNAGTNNDVLVMKVSSDGTFLWQNVYGGTFNDYAYKMIKTSDGGFLAAGTTYNFGAANGDAYLIKLKSDGSLDWSKTYGGDQLDEAFDITENAGHDFMVVGVTSSFGLVSGDMLLFKTDHTGFVYTGDGWPRTIGSPLGPDAATSVAVASDGSFFITGFLGTAPTTSDIFVAHYYGNSVFDYCRTYGTGTNTDKGSAIISTGTNVIVGGIASSFGAGGNDFMLMNMKTDSTGRYTACIGDNGITPVGGSPANMTVLSVTTSSYPTAAPVAAIVTVTTGTPGTSVNTQCSQ